MEGQAMSETKLEQQCETCRWWDLNSRPALGYHICREPTWNRKHPHYRRDVAADFTCKKWQGKEQESKP